VDCPKCEILFSPSDDEIRPTSRGDVVPVACPAEESPRRNWLWVLLLPTVSLATVAVVVFGIILFLERKPGQRAVANSARDQKHERAAVDDQAGDRSDPPPTPVDPAPAPVKAPERRRRPVVKASSPPPPGEPVAKVSGPRPLGEPVAKLTIDKLHSEYGQNVIAADKEYAGKTVELTARGKVKQSNGRYLLDCVRPGYGGSGGGFGRAQIAGAFTSGAVCYINPDKVDAFATLKQGETCQIRGRVKGRQNAPPFRGDLDFIVVVEDCEIVSSP
jgi:hypothetical protein